MYIIVFSINNFNFYEMLCNYFNFGQLFLIFVLQQQAVFSRGVYFCITKNFVVLDIVCILKLFLLVLVIFWEYFWVTFEYFWYSLAVLLWSFERIRDFWDMLHTEYCVLFVHFINVLLFLVLILIIYVMIIMCYYVLCAMDFFVVKINLLFNKWKCDVENIF